MADIQSVSVPDIGGAQDVSVIEILVKPGDQIEKDASIVTLESDKASMEVPAPFAGVVKEVKVKIGDKVSEGSLLLTVSGASAESKPAQSQPKAAPETQKPAAEAAPAKASAPVETAKPQTEPTPEPTDSELLYAGPATRRLARELGVSLDVITGTGPKGRILTEDLHRYVKNALAGSKQGGGGGLPAQPTVDFSKYGAVESQPLTRIKKLSGANLHRNWLLVPHITQFGEADITEMEAFRNAQKDEAQKRNIKMTPLIFLMKAVVAALKQYPQFNASLDASLENLIMKKYFHIGVAVDTPNGLVVPVVRDVDQKGLWVLAQELAVLSDKARKKTLLPNDMEGSSFSISSLGGIGGSAFTPIVNVPDVAILGVSKAEIKPVYQDGQFVPRLKLPLSLSYDHRVIDGADGARFMQYLTDVLSDIRRLLL